MKKLLSYLLVIALVLVQFTPVVSAVSAKNGKNDDSGIITISNAIGGQTYNAYQVLILESYDAASKAYTYVVKETAEDVTNSWYYFLTQGAGKDYVTLTPSNDGYHVVTWKEDKQSEDDVKAFSLAAMEFVEKNNIAPTQTQKTSGTPTDGQTYEVNFEGLNLGYYLVDSSLGILCNLTTTNPTISIEAKNGVPTVDKVVKEDSASWTDKNHDDIGKTIYYETTIYAQDGAQDYVLYDKMDKGLTLNEESIKVTKGNTELVKGTDYFVAVDKTVDGIKYTFEIDFAKSVEDELKDGDTLVVSYNALLNKDAVIASTGNKNETHLEYGDNNESNYDYTITYTYKFDLVKENADQQVLPGAQFELYKSATGDDKINLVEENGVYRVATPEEAEAKDFESAIIEVGSATIIGLDAGTTYYLEETVAPNGYNQLTSRVPVTINATFDSEDVSTSTVSGEKSTTVKYEGTEATVINTTGALLPSTGGMGTVLFVTIGSIMVMGFGVILVTKLRMAKESI